MATLETQYKQYQTQNPESKLTFEEWKEMFFSIEIKISKEKLKEIIKEEKHKQIKTRKGILAFIKRKLFNRTEE